MEGKEGREDGNAAGINVGAREAHFFEALAARWSAEGPDTVTRRVQPFGECYT